MARLSKFVLTETKRDLTSSVDNVSVKPAVEKQIDKFSSNYTSKKINELYNEFDAITLSPKEIEDNQEHSIEGNKHSFKTMLILGVSAIVSLLLGAMFIYNIFVIKDYSSSIDLLQRDVAVSQAQMDISYEKYTQLSDQVSISEELAKEGYQQAGETVSIKRLPRIEVKQKDAETNWFSRLCNFTAKVFGR